MNVTHSRRLASFLTGGAAIAVFGAALLFTEVEFFRIGEKAANNVQLVVTLVLNFMFNQMVTWRDKPDEAILRRVLLFGVTRLATLYGNSLLFGWLVTSSLNLQYMTAYAVCLVLTTGINYWTSFYLVFTQPSSSSPTRKVAA